MPLLTHGIPLILAPNPLPETLRLAAAGLPAITLPAVPVLWRAWHEAEAIPPNVRLAISAGAPLSGGLERSVFAATGIKIHNFYGSSECGGIAFDHRNELRPDEACVGTPLENVEVSISREGCLCVHSGAVGECYWPIADEVLGGGRFQTSDLAEIGGGEVFLRGRFSEQINVAGRKVSPAVVERVVREYPGVDDCLVFGVPNPDADRADVIVACVVSQTALAAEDLRQFALRRLPAWQVPREWRQVESLGTNVRGKISRAEWREKLFPHGLRRDRVQPHTAR
jgi:acyl-CoA synthetase (AMP-forming)/AMP-acid ligase II